MKQRRIRRVYSGLGKLIPAVIFCLFCAVGSRAQIKDNPSAPIRNLKLVKEYKDSKGYTIREVQYTKGLMRVSETIIIPPSNEYRAIHTPINPDTMDKKEVTILVDKAHYYVKVFYRKRPIRMYKAVFGPKPMLNKCMEGDRCTPEGSYKITMKNPNSKYHKFMLINYPNDSAVVRFNKLKAAGRVPATAKIGGDIGIHGIWPGGDDMIEMGVGWTDGCIALKNRDVDELYAMVGIGTQVTIKK